MLRFSSVQGGGQQPEVPGGLRGEGESTCIKGTQQNSLIPSDQETQSCNISRKRRKSFIAKEKGSSSRVALGCRVSTGKLGKEWRNVGGERRGICKKKVRKFMIQSCSGNSCRRTSARSLTKSRSRPSPPSSSRSGGKCRRQDQFFCLLSPSVRLKRKKTTKTPPPPKPF